MRSDQTLRKYVKRFTVCGNQCFNSFSIKYITVFLPLVIILQYSFSANFMVFLPLKFCFLQKAWCWQWGRPRWRPARCPPALSAGSRRTGLQQICSHAGPAQPSVGTEHSNRPRISRIFELVCNHHKSLGEHAEVYSQKSHISPQLYVFCRE